MTNMAEEIMQQIKAKEYDEPMTEKRKWNSGGL